MARVQIPRRFGFVQRNTLAPALFFDASSRVPGNNWRPCAFKGCKESRGTAEETPGTSVVLKGEGTLALRPRKEGL